MPLKDKVTWVLYALAGVLTTGAFLMTFLWASPTTYPDGRVNFSQKIFYFHVPLAEASFLVLIIAAIFSIQFLRKRERRYDTMARVAMEVTLVFVLLTMAMGILWTRAEWGVWWVWEPRLTTYFILTLGVIAYFVLRNAVEDEERRGVYSAVVAILVAIDAPISFAITRIYRSYHPVVFGGGADSGLEPDMLATFIVAQIGVLALGYVIYQMRMREERVKDRLEAAKTALEG